MRWIERLSSLALSVGGWAYLAAAGLICFDIVARRLLGFSTGATTELSGYLMAVGMAWGFAGTLYERAHVRIDVLVQKLPLPLRGWLHTGSLLVLTIVAGFFAYGAASLTLDSLDLHATDLSSLQLPLAIPQSLWAAGILLLLLACVALLARSMRGLMSGDHTGVERLLLARGYEEESQETLEALAGAGDVTPPQKQGWLR